MMVADDGTEHVFSNVTRCTITMDSKGVVSARLELFGVEADIAAVREDADSAL